MGWFLLIFGTSVWFVHPLTFSFFRVPGLGISYFTLADGLGILLYLVVQGGIVMGFLKLKTGTGSLKGKLGLGDLFFWISILPLFSFFNFVLFHLISMMVALVGHTLWNRIQAKVRIPLAGWQAACLLADFMLEASFGISLRIFTVETLVY